MTQDTHNAGAEERPAVSPPPYRIERVNTSHIRAIEELHAAVYGTRVPSPDFRHKFDTTAIGQGHSFIGYAAFAGTVMAALYGVYPVTLGIQGRSVLGAQSGDTMTHPAHRGQGLFVKLAHRTYETAKLEGIDFVFGVPNWNSYPGFVRKLGWSHEVNLNAYVVPVLTIPLGGLPNRGSSESQTRMRLRSMLLRRLGRAVEAQSLPVHQGADGFPVRDEQYLAYKQADLLWGIGDPRDPRVVFRLGRSLEIGDLAVPDGLRLRTLARLYLMAVISGTLAMRFYTSPGTPSDQFLRRFMKPREGLPIGFLDLSGQSDPSRLRLSALDLDTY